MPVTRADVRVRRMEWPGVSVDVVEEDGRRGVSCESRVRIVCRGRSGSQDSIQGVEGSKAPVVEL